MKELTIKIDDNDLNFTVNSTGNDSDFSEIDDPITFLNKIKSNKTTLDEAKASQKDFHNYLKLMQIGKKTENQKKTLENINKPFNGRNYSIKFVEDYGLVIFEVKKKLLKN